MPFLTCDEPIATQRFLPGNLTVTNGGKSPLTNIFTAVKAKIFHPGEDIPDTPVGCPGCIDMAIDMTGTAWWSTGDIPVIQVGGNTLAIWGLEDGAGWQLPTKIPITGEDMGAAPVLPPPAQPAPAVAPAVPPHWPAALRIRVARNRLSTGFPGISEFLNSGALQAQPFSASIDVFGGGPGEIVWTKTTSTVIPEDPDSESKWLVHLPDETKTFAMIYLVQRVATTVRIFRWYTLSFNAAAETTFSPYSLIPPILNHSLKVSPA